MSRREQNEDARVWASSIGANTIDICDRVVQPTRPLRAPLVPTDKLAGLRALLEDKVQRA